MQIREPGLAPTLRTRQLPHRRWIVGIQSHGLLLRRGRGSQMELGRVAHEVAYRISTTADKHWIHTRTHHFFSASPLSIRWMPRSCRSPRKTFTSLSACSRLMSP